MTAAVNPYAAPAARVEDIPANPEAEAIRRVHINHEASIRAVGLLDYLGGALLTVVGLASLTALNTGSDTMIALAIVVVGLGHVVAGWGVRAFKPWGRILGCVVSAIGMLAFPFGTLINGYILYLFLSKKGRTIFAPDYKDVIAATPHVKYRTSIVVWILLALVVVLVIVAAGAGNYMLDAR